MLPQLLAARVAVSAMFFLNGALWGIWASRVPTFAERFSLSEGTLGVILLCMAGGAVVSFQVAGALTDRIGPARLSRWIAALYVGALFLLPLAPTPVFLAIFLLIFGMMHGGMDVAMNGWAAEVETKSGRAIMSSFHAIFSLGAGLGAASGWVAAQVQAAPGPHFWVLGTILGAVALWLAAVPWVSTARTHDGPLFAVPRGTLLLVALVALGAGLGEGAMADWSAIYLTEVVRVGEGPAALGYAAFSAMMVVVRLSGDLAVRRFGPVACAAVSAGTALAGVLLVIVTRDFGLSLLGFALMGAGYAIVAPIVYSRAANDPVVSPGRALAGVVTLGYGGMLIGPPVIGFLAQITSLPLAFGLLAVMAAAMIPLARVLRP